MEEYKVLLRFGIKQDKKKLIVPKEDYELITSHVNYDKCCFNNCSIEKFLINYENILNYYTNGINETNALDVVKFFVYFKINEKLIEIYAVYDCLKIDSIILFYAIDNIKFDFIKLILNNISSQ